MGRAITKWGARAKNPLLLSQYLKNKQFDRTPIIIFECTNNIFANYMIEKEKENLGKVLK